MNRIYLLAIVLILTTSCSRLDTTQTIRECMYEGEKLHLDKYSFLTICMHKNGYDFTFEPSCVGDMTETKCWNKTWRIFL